MTENHLGDPDIVFGVFCDINAVAVVLNGDGAVGADVYINVGDKFGVVGVGAMALNKTNHVVSGIYNALVEELV